MNYENLKATIAANIYQNASQEVSANKVKTAMDAAVDSLGAGYQYLGIATPETTPGTPDARVFYIATTPGDYENFGAGISVADGEVAVLKFDTAWTKEVTGAATAAQLTELGQVFKDKTINKAIVDGYIDFGTSGYDLDDFSIYRLQKPATNPKHPSLFFRFNDTQRSIIGSFLTDDMSVCYFEGYGMKLYLLVDWSEADYISQYDIYAIGDGVSYYYATKEIINKWRFLLRTFDPSMAVVRVDGNMLQTQQNDIMTIHNVFYSPKINKAIVDGYIDFGTSGYGVDDFSLSRLQKPATNPEHPSLYFRLNDTQKVIVGKFATDDMSVCVFDGQGIKVVLLVDWSKADYISQYDIYAVGDGESYYYASTEITITKGIADYLFPMPKEIKGKIVESLFLDQVVKSADLNIGQYNLIQKATGYFGRASFIVCVDAITGSFSGQINVVADDAGIGGYMNYCRVIDGKSFIQPITVKTACNVGIAWNPINSTDIIRVRIYKVLRNEFGEKYGAVTQSLCNPHIITHPNYTYDYFCDACKHPNGQLFVATTTATDALHEDYNAGFLAIRKTFLGHFDLVDFIKVSNSINEGGHDIDGVHYTLAGCPQVVVLNNGNIACRFSLYQAETNNPFLFYREYDVANGTLGNYTKLKIKNQNAIYVDFSRNNLVSIVAAIYGIDLSDDVSHITIDMMSIDKDENNVYYFALTISVIDTTGGGWIEKPTICLLVKSVDFVNWEIVAPVATTIGGNTPALLPISETAIVIKGENVYLVARSDVDGTQYFGIITTSGATVQPFIKIPYLSGHTTARLMIYQGGVYISGTTEGQNIVSNPPYGSNEVVCVYYDVDVKQFFVVFAGMTPNNAHPFEMFNFHNSIYALFTGDARHIEPVSAVSETDIEIVPIPNGLFL